MIIHITEKLLSQQDILKRAGKLQLSGLILPQNVFAVSQHETILEAEEENLLDLVIRMISHPFASLHVNYHLKTFNVPLVSLYIHSSHLFGLIFKKEGIRVVELLDQKDAVLLLTQCIQTLPSPEETERAEISTGVRTVEEAVAEIRAGRIQGTEQVREALKDNTCISFWMTGMAGEHNAMAVDLGNEVCNILEKETETVLLFGSAGHSVAAMNNMLMDVFRYSTASWLAAQQVGEDG